MTWPDVHAALTRFRTLEPDWDGEGSDPPPPDAIDHAEQVARFLDAIGAVPPVVVPSVTSTIQFEWHVGGRYAEIEIESGDKPANLYVPKEER